MYFVHVIWRGEAPGAAPTRWKRGPWRPLWTGRQGRLPTWLASPRRELLVYLFFCKNILDTALISKRIRMRWKLILLVVAMGGGTRVLEGRAMVAGMAMAAWATADTGGGHMIA